MASLQVKQHGEWKYVGHKPGAMVVSKSFLIASPKDIRLNVINNHLTDGGQFLDWYTGGYYRVSRSLYLKLEYFC